MSIQEFCEAGSWSSETIGRVYIMVDPCTCMIFISCLGLTDNDSRRSKQWPTPRQVSSLNLGRGLLLGISYSALLGASLMNPCIAIILRTGSKIGIGFWNMGVGSHQSHIRYVDMVELELCKCMSLILGRSIVTLRDGD